MYAKNSWNKYFYNAVTLNIFGEIFLVLIPNYLKDAVKIEKKIMAFFNDDVQKKNWH